MDERYQEYGWDYDGTGIYWGDRGAAMISKAPYSTDTNGVRTLKKAANMRILSLIMDHGRIPFELVRGNEETYVQISARRAQDLRMIYEYIRDSLTKEGLAKVNT